MAPPHTTGSTSFFQTVLTTTIDPKAFYGPTQSSSQRTRPGPKRLPLVEKPSAFPKAIKTSKRYSYPAKYKLKVISYWKYAQIRCGPQGTRAPTIDKTALHFQIPKSCISRWASNELALLLVEGKNRKNKSHNWQYPELELSLYTDFCHQRIAGRIVRRDWFRQRSRQLFVTIYPFRDLEVFRFSNGWFCGFLSRQNISLRFSTNKAQKPPAEYVKPVIGFIQFVQRNSQLQPGDHAVRDAKAVGQYETHSIANMDQTPLPFEYLEGQTYKHKGSNTVWIKATGM